MAVGLPVVATNVGGNSELVIDGETGRLCGPGNAEELAVALRPYIENEALRAAQGAAGRSRIERHFALERMVEEYLTLYESLLARLH
jgi:glycosyltransferase involved in cell wall biosynthesis